MIFEFKKEDILDYSKLWQTVEVLCRDHKQGDEIPAETLKRIISSGVVTFDDFKKKPGVGGKSYKFILFICGLTEKSVIVPR